MNNLISAVSKLNANEFNLARAKKMHQVGALGDKAYNEIIENLPQDAVIPTVRTRDGVSETVADIYSALLDNFVICLHDEVNYMSASIITAEFLYLEYKDSSKTINFYINSPGGSVTDGLAIMDTMYQVKNPVNTLGMGMCASMGAFLLCMGKNQRSALANCQIMIHQPIGGTQGQATDVTIRTNFLNDLKEVLYAHMAARMDKDYETIEADCERDNWFSAERAKEYGLIDTILLSNSYMPIYEKVNAIRAEIKNKKKQELLKSLEK